MTPDFYKLENDKVFGYWEDNDDKRDMGDVYSFAKHLKIPSMMFQALTRDIDVHGRPEDEDLLKKKIEERVKEAFKKFFKENDEPSYEDVFDFGEELIDEYKQHRKELFHVIHNFINTKLDKNKKAYGGDMFKNLKEAKLFTAHLDALANEIQELEGVSDQMRLHLAYRLDKLSDLIETDAQRKEASVSKEANGVGSGSWVYDSDEARYMSSMGGTGALRRDPDEGYMDEFKGDDHKEVLERKEPSSIMGAGSKKKQPSDDYNQAAVAKKLRSYVKKAMEKLKEE
jgi:hypothetical protein